jgi:hypothetical protein
MKAYWGVEVELHAFFDFGTRWRWVCSVNLQMNMEEALTPHSKLTDRHVSPGKLSVYKFLK